MKQSIRSVSSEVPFGTTRTDTSALQELGLPGNSDNPRSMQTLLMKLGLARGSQPSASLRSLIENGTVRLIPSVKEDEDVKPEGPSDDFPEEITVKDIFQAHPKLLLPSSSTQNGHSVEYNKVRICDNGREYRNTLASSSNKIGVVIDPPSLNPSSGVQKTVTRGSSGSSVIARSLACLAKYRTTSQESEKTLLNPVKPPQADEISNGSIEKVVKAEAVELPSEPAEMKEHIVPLF